MTCGALMLYDAFFIYFIYFHHSILLFYNVNFKHIINFILEVKNKHKKAP
ncbi:Uncharacterised protein [Yersinia enterocolitica]|nr:hypothetical protein DJ60_1998 [Yersinia enterocolitica]CFQ08231.1 Uncharacterised protein [Yersinia enterocolitica]CNE22241.1 Uncharacterised protein [Yersinia enterocolitica]CNF18586.1 Uncharacterised protein [Yersinia enterocolitica]CNI52197.1 Uncharacterised protein [Yersinia enterocolitica]